MLKRFAAIVGSLMFALSLWGAVNLSNEIETTLAIETNIVFPEGSASKTSVPPIIRVTLKATGWQLVRLLYNRRPVCTLNLHDIQPEGGVFIIRQRDMIEHCLLPAEARVETVEPDSLSIILDNNREKTVPVIPDISLECKKNFQVIGSLHAEPDSVTIEGAQSIIEPITAWRTQHVGFKDVVTSVRNDVPLSDSLTGSITLSRKTTAITADIQEIAEKRFDGIPITILNQPEGIHVSLEPAYITVWLRGGAETLSDIEPRNIHASVNYFTLAENHPDLASISISAPDETSMLFFRPESVNWFVREHQ